MKFRNMRELVKLCEDRNISFSRAMLEYECETNGMDREKIISRMADKLSVMKASAERGLKGLVSYSGMTGGNAKLIHDYMLKGDCLTGGAFLDAISIAIAINENNAAMGVICATPTAGSCGVVPGVLLALQKSLNKTDDDIIKALFAAGAVGYIIANNAVISGATGGCQAEVGSASAMAAAAAVELKGGSPSQCAHACAIALKNMLGLSCDPLAGLVEVPCIKRNAAGAANALCAAEMALAGVISYVPYDEVIDSMYRIGISMPLALRETALGGLASSETGKKWKEKLWSGSSHNE